MMRDRLVDAAFHVCEIHGVAGLTMRRLAAQAGVTAPAIYRYFAGKQEVQQAMVDWANAQLAVYLARAESLPGPWPVLEGTLTALTDFALEHPRACDVLFFTRNRVDKELMPERLRSPNFRTFFARIERCLESGVIRKDLDAMTVALTLWAHAQGLLSLHLQGRFGGSAERLRTLLGDGLQAIARGILDPGFQGRHT